MKKISLLTIPFCVYASSTFAQSATLLNEVEACEDNQKCQEIDLNNIKNNRIITNGTGSVIYFHNSKTQNIIEADIEEKQADTRIKGDSKILLKLLAKVTERQNFTGTNEPVRSKYTYIKFIQKFNTSTLNIDVNYTDQILKEGEYSLRVGPTEHMYLTIDMPVSKLKQLKYDENSNSLIEKEKQDTFYLGFNYKIGDLYEKYNLFSKDWYKNFSFKALLKVSEKPFDSYGVGMGYAFDNINIQGLDLLKNFEVFTAYMSTVEDKDKYKIQRNERVVFGISFNISKGLDWLN